MPGHEGQDLAGQQFSLAKAACAILGHGLLE